MTASAKTIDLLADFFRQQIQAKREHTSTLAKRVALRTGRAPKRTGLTAAQEAALIATLTETVRQHLSIKSSVTLWVDYEPQGLLRDIALSANLSASTFCYDTFLPPKTEFVISAEHVTLNGSEIELTK